MSVLRPNRLHRFLVERRGVTAIEYAIIAGIIAVAIVTGVKSIGPSLVTVFNSAGAEL